MRPLLWVSKSHAKLADALYAMGHPISPNTVGTLLQIGGGKRPVEDVPAITQAGDRANAAVPAVTDDAEAEQTPAWERLENGRYRPRRIRGSYRGRELG